jgi:hypothetical protein
MKSIAAAILAAFLCAALPAEAQTTNKTPSSAVLERAKKRCLEQRGSDCQSTEGLRPWIVEETPLTKEQQQAAAAARHRRECAAIKNKPVTCPSS